MTSLQEALEHEFNDFKMLDESIASVRIGDALWLVSSYRLDDRLDILEIAAPCGVTITEVALPSWEEIRNHITYMLAPLRTSAVTVPLSVSQETYSTIVKRSVYMGLLSATLNTVEKRFGTWDIEANVRLRMVTISSGPHRLTLRAIDTDGSDTPFADIECVSSKGTRIVAPSHSGYLKPVGRLINAMHLIDGNRQ